MAIMPFAATRMWRLFFNPQEIWPPADKVDLMYAEPPPQIFTSGLGMPRTDSIANGLLASVSCTCLGRLSSLLLHPSLFFGEDFSFPFPADSLYVTGVRRAALRDGQSCCRQRSSHVQPRKSHPVQVHCDGLHARAGDRLEHPASVPGPHGPQQLHRNELCR